MKNILVKIFTVAFLFYVTGCTSDFDDINTNPNTLTADQLDASMAGPSFANAQYKGLGNASWSLPGDDYGTYGLATMLHSMLFVHYMSAGSEGWQTERNGINDGWRSRGWLRFYTIAVPSLRNAYTAAEGNPEALAILDIWNVYMFHRFTDSWGPIPYSKAGLGGETVPYESQEAIYDDFFNLLNAADETLKASSENTVAIFKDYDAIYSGDVEKWRKFGNSLKLRLALRISNVDAAKAQSEAEDAISSGVIESNDESAVFETTPDTYNNFVDIVSWGFYMTADMESILKGYNDPRLSIWFSPVSDTNSSYEGEYVGQPNGGATERDWNTTDLSSTNKETTFASNVDKNIEVLMAAEVSFNRAECALNGWNAGGTAQSFYEEGIRSSLTQWGVEASGDIDTYIAGTTTAVEPTLVAEYTKVGTSTTPPVDVPVSWAASVDDQRKQIAVQKYLALFPESWEAWADLRRSDADILYPLLTTDDPGVGTGIMKRLTYLPNEYSTNEEAVNAAVELIPGKQDVGSARVWWDVD